MLKVAAKNGTTDIVLTPHYMAEKMRCAGLDKAQLAKAFDEFKEKVKEQIPNINIYQGAELFSISSIEDCMENDEIITINDTDYVLLEFGFNDNPKRALEISRALQSGGYKVVIAHPERYDFIQQNPRLIVPFLQDGVALQLNADSVLGLNGFAAQDVALSFMENNFATVIASDSHSSISRSPDLSEVYSFVSSNFSPDYAQLLLRTNPLTIIKGKRL